MQEARDYLLDIAADFQNDRLSLAAFSEAHGLLVEEGLDQSRG